MVFRLRLRSQFGLGLNIKDFIHLDYNPLTKWASLPAVGRLTLTLKPIDFDFLFKWERDGLGRSS